MITESDLQKIESTAENGRWYVHNGFFGWAYGSPLNPTPVTRDTAKGILERMTISRFPDAIARLSAFPNALDYADDGDDLCLATGGNRLIAFLPPSECVFESGYKVPAEQAYQI